MNEGHLQLSLLRPAARISYFCWHLLYHRNKVDRIWKNLNVLTITYLRNYTLIKYHFPCHTPMGDPSPCVVSWMGREQPSVAGTTNPCAHYILTIVTDHLIILNPFCAYWFQVVYIMRVREAMTSTCDFWPLVCINAVPASLDGGHSSSQGQLFGLEGLVGQVWWWCMFNNSSPGELH